MVTTHGEMLDAYSTHIFVRGKHIMRITFQSERVSSAACK